MAYPSATPSDPTLEAPLSPSLGGPQSGSDSPCARVAMCEGSGQHLSKETQSLLRSRLRTAALLLTLGFGVFFVRNLFFTDYMSGVDLAMMFYHGAVVLTLALIGGGLCHRCEFKRSTLLVAELVIFGLPASFFVTLEWLQLHALSASMTQQEAMIAGHLESPAAPWILLIFIYSLYIPNTWQRASWIIGAMAAIPVTLFIIAWFVMPHIGENVSLLQISTIALMMSLAGVVGGWGVYTMGRLRREAFEARQLGQYKLKRLLGAGGMGEVHLAEHQLMKRPVALKLIKPSRAADPQAIARFEREVRAMSRLSHANTVEIFDYGHTSDGTFYYVMEYLPGKSLADLVEQHGPLAPERVVSLIEQTCDALSEAHSLGLIHRDIKPGNIFAAERGGVFDVAKLLDFGLAKPIVSTSDVNLTQEGAITGSPLFMAPEQAAGDGLPDARSDIYALGAVAYYLLTGKPPFEAENPVKVLLAHAGQAVVPPSQLRPGIPADLEQIVMRCLAKNPAERFADVITLGEALAACESHGRWTREHARRWWQSHGAQGIKNDIPPRSPQRTSPTNSNGHDLTQDSDAAVSAALAR